VRRSFRSCSLALLAVLLAVPAAGAATGPTLHFTLFAQTDLPLGQATWTGSEWLWNAENDGKIEAADAGGRNVRPFAAFDQGGEEMRCSAPPNKLWPDGVYCHTPDNRVVRLNRDGSNLTQLAKLPATGNSDGGLVFDDVGRFGYALLVSTGARVRRRPGVRRAQGRPRAGDRLVSWPRGRREPRDRAGEVRHGRRCLPDRRRPGLRLRPTARDRPQRHRADARERARERHQPDRRRPLAPKPRPAGPAPGLYLADTASRQIWFAPASDFAAFVASVVVATELTGQLWAIRPNASGGFDALPAASDLPQRPWNLEGSTYVS
jgi:hypothetical protein